MKILIVSQYFYPEQFLINDIATRLVGEGHIVTVVTGFPNYPQGEFYKGYENLTEYTDSYKNVKILRVKIHPRKSSTFHLVINYLSFTINAIKRIIKIKEIYDIVFCYELSPIIQALPAIMYARNKKVPCLLYCLDIWPESILSHISKKNFVIYPIIKKISNIIFQCCDHIIVSSLPFIGYLNEINNVPLNKLSYLPQHADESFLNINFSKTHNEKFHFLFAGNMGAGQTLDVIVHAAKILSSRKDFIIDMVGDGSSRKQIIEQVNKENLMHLFCFYGYQQKEKMINYYMNADGLLITLRGNTRVGDTLPGKLQTYMTVGKPIFGAINGAAQQIIQDAKCGACVNAGDYIGLAKIMEDFMEYPQKYENCGENARKYFKDHFTLTLFIENFIKRCTTMIEAYKLNN